MGSIVFVFQRVEGDRGCVKLARIKHYVGYSDVNLIMIVEDLYIMIFEVQIQCSKYVGNSFRKRKKVDEYLQGLFC